MERIDIHTTTAGADEVACVSAEIFENSPDGGIRKATLSGDLFEDRILHVGFIGTEEEWRRTGAAQRLLVHVIDVLGVQVVEAGTVDGVADAFFESVAQAAPSVRFNID